MKENLTPSADQLLLLCVGSSISNPKDLHPCTIAEFLNTANSPQVISICNQIMQLPNTEESKTVRKQLKERLPYFCFNASRFVNNHRSNQNATPSGFCMIDWDKVDDTTSWLSAFGSTPDEQKRQLRICGLVGFHLSPSGHGFHGIIKMREGETIEQAQARVARIMNKEDYDKGAHALSQSSFAVPRSYWLYFDYLEMLADATHVEPIEGQNEPSATPSVPALTTTAVTKPVDKNETIEEAEVLSEETESDLQNAYDGVPMRMIVNAIIYDIMKLTQDPVEGTRNNTYLTLQRHLRYFCEFDIDMMLREAPDWGLPEQERRSACISAAKYDRVPGMPRVLQEMLERLKEQIKLAEGVTINTKVSCPMPKNKPRLLKLLLKLMPEEFEEEVFFCSLPALGSLATALRYRHHEVKVETPSFQVYLRGHMSSGKSFMRVIDSLLMAPIDADDERLMQRENDWREEFNAAGEGKKQREQHNVIRRVQPDFTLPALRKQLFNARKQHLYLFSEESDSVRMNKELSSILRNAYDGAKSGQSRVSAQSVNGQAVTFINTLLSGTPTALNRWLPNPEDGLVSRNIFVDLPDRLGEDEPAYGHLTQTEYRQLEEEVLKLHRIGLLENVQNLPDYQPEHTEVWIPKLPRTENFITSFNAAIKCEFFMSGCKNIALEKFGRRMATHLRRISMVLYAMEGCKETTRSIDILRWAAERMLTNVLNLYGHQYEEIYHKSNAALSPYKRQTKNASLIEMLPDHFSVNDIITTQQKRGYTCTLNNAYVIANRLKGYIEPTGEPNHWRKVKEMC